jgi:hypothetical protein
MDFWRAGEQVFGVEAKGLFFMSIHKYLPRQARKRLEEAGWAKGLELANVARRDAQHFDFAT